MANYSVLWDETTPAGSEVKSLGDNRIRELKAQLRERLNTEHDAITGTAGDALLLHKWLITSKSTGSPYTALVTDHVLLITTGASDYTINLPTAVGISGKLYTIKKVDSGAGTVIIDPSAAQTIDGGATFVLTHQYSFVDIMSDGANWLLISTNTNFDWDTLWTDPVHTHASDAEGGVLAGRTVQVVNTQTGAVATGTTVMVVDDTIPQITEGDQYMTLAITPTSDTNKLKIDVVIHLANDNSSSYNLVAALFQDATANALAVAQSVKTGSYGNNMIHQVKFTYYMTSGTTSETTFRVRAGSTVGTNTFNGVSGGRLYGGVLSSSITITEIAV